MSEKIAIVITSIASPSNQVLREIAQESQRRNHQFIVIGDVPSPHEFQLEGCDFYSLERQLQLDLQFPKICPKRHYARKNIGYLIAIRDGASLILETDDDNIPYDSFWKYRDRQQSVPTLSGLGWVNAYGYFTGSNIWPRGFPLQALTSSLGPTWDQIKIRDVDSPIQQGLADENPDVDAIYRLTLPLPQVFRSDRRIALSTNAWCPFNSQNTAWWQDAYPLLYLPAYCSFRMTDIWRSFVAQRIAWLNGWSILFHEPTVWQERNQHNLIKDFEDEIPGYLHNYEICEALESLCLRTGVDKLGENLRICYEKLVSLSLVDVRELELVETWLNDLQMLSHGVREHTVASQR
ncbi:MAG: STELLO glycosyltransferase family protein [Cyanobacteria bacterium P01_D01_bin.44]